MKNKICETMFWKLSSAIHSNNYYLFHHLEDVIDGTMLLMIFIFFLLDDGDDVNNGHVVFWALGQLLTLLDHPPKRL